MLKAFVKPAFILLKRALHIIGNRPGNGYHLNQQTLSEVNLKYLKMNVMPQVPKIPPCFLDNNTIASWKWDLTTDVFFYGSGFESLLGYSTHFLNHSRVSMTSLICIDDVERVILNIDEVIHKQLSFWKDSYRMLKADGTFQFVTSDGLIYRNNKGSKIKMNGIIKKYSYGQQ